MSVKNTIFDDKKISKGKFCKNITLINIYNLDVGKTLISKKKPSDKKARLNTFLDIMIMMSLDLYV